MKVIFDKQTLAKALQTVSRTAPMKPTIPSLRGVKIVVNDDGVTLTTSNQETTTTTTISAEVDEPGEALVSAKLMADVVPKLPNKPVQIELQDAGLAIECGTSKFTFPTMNLDDYPPTPELPELIGELDGTSLAECVRTVDVAASNDDTLPMLTGIHIEAKDSGITFTATDRFRLGMCHTGWNSSGFTILVPNKTMIDVARLCDGEPTDIYTDIYVGDGVAGFAVDGTHIITRLLTSDFPKVGGLIANSHPSWLRVNRKALTDAVKRVALVSRTISQIKLDINGNELTVSANSTPDGSATEQLECESFGEPLTIAFNPTYLLGGLSSSNSDEVVVGYENQGRPATLYPGYVETAGKLTPPENTPIYLLMPVRINQ